MNYVIVGAGALGQSFAGLLAQGGQRVTLLATPRSASRLQATGALRLHGAVEATIPVGAGGVLVTRDANDVPDGAAVLFATKGYDLAEAIDTVKTSAGARVAWAAGVQNGIVKDDLLAHAFGADRIVAAVTIFGANRQPDGSVQVTSPGATYFGELSGPISERVQQTADTFQAAGIPAQARDDIASVLWSKACNATGVFGVTVLARASTTQLFANPHFMRAYLVLVRETAAIAAAYGVQVGNYPSFPPIRTFVDRDEEETVRQLGLTAGPRATASSPTRSLGRAPGAGPGQVNYASMTQDLLAGAPLEVEAIFGDIVRRAEAKALFVPALRLVRDLIRGLDPRQSP
ncbi:MAG TPA: 2-dehydropantoate 2-reductase [Chloroflexota bacterium]|nr:2-dehydropantoate 2-reductase [Chloroflexota bacterium]